MEIASENRKLLALDLSSGRKRAVVEPGRGYHEDLALSPDGERIVFQASSGTKDLLLMVPAKGGEVRTLHETETGLLGQLVPFSWSADGRYILFVERPDVKSASELWRLPVQGGQPEKLGLAAEGLHGPRVTPDGTRITYSSGNFVRSEIWVLENFLPLTSAKK
jgi:Tol biopolymer transport system component